jgi:hypothetical protein
MCWLAQWTRGVAKLGECVDRGCGPNPCEGNRVGFGPQDYWIKQTESLWEELIIRIWVRILLAIAWIGGWRQHVHKWQEIRPGARRCAICDQWENIDVAARSVRAD